MSIEEYLKDADENGKRYFDVNKIRKEIERKKMEELMKCEPPSYKKPEKYCCD